MSGRVLGHLLAAAAAVVVLSPRATAGEGGGARIILDTTSFWRAHYTLRTPVYRDGDGVKKFGSECNSDFAPGKWTSPDYDDSLWNRKPGAPFQSWSHWQQAAKANVGFIYLHQSSPALAVLCMRGKFEVKDPGAAAGLSLSIEYRGGFIAYVNGKEFARGHMAKGASGPEALAEDYPLDACLKKGGQLFTYRKDAKSPDIRKRIRKCSGVAVPKRLLRKGSNVLAIAVHRAAYAKEAVAKMKAVKGHEYTQGSFDACGITSIRLSGGGASVVQNVTRPTGFQVWNSDALASDFDFDFGDPCEPLRPLKLVGARNGSFSGKVVVGSTGAIKGLKGSVSDLTGPGRIPSSAAQVRYALPTSSENSAGNHYPAPVNRFDALAEKPPAEIPVRAKSLTSRTRVLPGQPKPVYGAVVPVWVTVNVPPDAKVGDYKGTLTIEADGVEKTEVPIALKVLGYTLPAPKEFATFVELIQSPDSVALYYSTPLWSDKHFELMGASFRKMGLLGVKVVYVPLICTLNLGNEESMVRWIKAGEGKYRHDFSIMDRYLDVVEKNMGKPSIMCLGVWDVFLEGGRFGGRGFEVEGKTVQAARNEVKGKGPRVTLLDPATKKTEMLQLPKLSDPASKALWAPLCSELRKRMKKRGLEKAVALGMATDARPTAAVSGLFSALLPGAGWVCHGHGYPKDLHGVPWVYTTAVWRPRYIEFPGKSMYGWKKPDLLGVQFARNTRDAYPQTTFRLIGEINIGGHQRGFGWFGADYWPVIKDRRGRRTQRTYLRYPHANWRNLNIMTALLGPSPDGPVATQRFEMMREGVQECEARIFIEKALLDKKISGDLAKRCEELMVERNQAILMGLDNHMLEGWLKDNSYGRVHGWWNSPGLVGGYWYLTSGWQQRSEKLYSAAAEVAAKLGNAGAGSVK